MKSPLNNGYLFQKTRWLLIIKSIDCLGSIFLKPFIFYKELPTFPQKILLSKIDHLGDVIIFLSVLPLIRQIYPAIKIHVLAGNWAKSLLNKHPEIDVLIIYNDFFLNRNGSPFQRLLNWVITFFNAWQRLRKEQYDIGIDFRANFPNSLFLLFLGGVRYRIGYGTGGFGFLLHKQGEWTSGIHEREHQIGLINLLDQPIKNHSPKISLDYLIDLERTSHFLLTKNIKENESFIIIHPTSGAKIKYWPAKYWHEVIDNLSECKILLVGSEKENDFIKTILVKRSENIFNCVGETDIPLLAGILTRARLVIGVESFVSHLAASLGIPSVIIVNGVADINQWRPIGQVKIISNPVECAPCYRSNGCNTMDCMNVVPSIVVSAVKEILYC